MLSLFLQSSPEARKMSKKLHAFILSSKLTRSFARMLRNYMLFLTPTSSDEWCPQVGWRSHACSRSSADDDLCHLVDSADGCASQAHRQCREQGVRYSMPVDDCSRYKAPPLRAHSSKPPPTKFRKIAKKRHAFIRPAKLSQSFVRLQGIYMLFFTHSPKLPQSFVRLPRNYMLPRALMGGAPRSSGGAMHAAMAVQLS